MKDFDELLDEVLREDAAAEPRAGLEARVMARVRAEAEHGSALRLGNWWRAWMLGPVAACLGIVAMVWYVSGGGVSQSDRAGAHISPPVLSVETPGIESSHSVARGDIGLNVGESGRAMRDAHLSDEKTITKMGHPDLEDGPKLDTFPAVSQKGDVAGWLGSGDDGKLAAIARQVTPEVAKAYQQLQAVQSEPIDIAAIEIKPLQ
jgi:hypothetical protein